MSIPAVEKMSTMQVLRLAMIHTLVLEAPNVGGLSPSPDLTNKIQRAQQAIDALIQAYPRRSAGERSPLRLIQGGKP